MQPAGFMRGHVFTGNHRVVGIQYLLLSLVAALLGVALSMLMRLRLAWPAEKWPLLEQLFPVGFAGGPMAAEFYLAMLTMHGTLMVFFVLTVAPLAGFGTCLLPLQIGARGMAFPRLSALSFWTVFTSFAVLIAALFVTGGAPVSGWTAYPPFSALGAVAGPGQGAGQTLWIVSILIFCLGSILSALNFLATIFNLRAPGLPMMGLPLTVWAWFTASLLVLLTFPVLLGGGILLLLDRFGATSFFVPEGLVVSGRLIQRSGGGSPVLWQHIFWFFGHPEVYIAILPGMGVVSHVLATFARRPVFSYKAMVGSTFAIGLLSYIVWGHHMFTSGMSPAAGAVFSMTTLTVGVPSAVKTFNWLATLWGGQIRFTAAMLFALGFVSLFATGGVTGILLAQPAIDIYLHDTYFVVAHFHIIMGVAAMFGIFAAMHYWFPLLFGRMMSETLGKIHFWATLTGTYAIFLPMHFLGLAGAPRRYAQLTEFQYLAKTQGLTVFISIVAFLTAAAQLLFVFNFVRSAWKGRPAEANPWDADTLEWHRDGFDGASATSSNARTGIWLAIAAITMLFLGLASAYVVSEGLGGPSWRAAAMPKLLWVASGLLIAGSAALAVGAARDSKLGTGTAIALVSAFLVALVSVRANLPPGTHATFIAILTALHGLFALCGIAAAAVRPRWEALPVYWHFLTALWICLMGLLFT